jgi:hypothetical protein
LVFVLAVERPRLRRKCQRRRLPTDTCLRDSTQVPSTSLLSSLARGPSKTNDGPRRGWLVPRRPKKYQGWSDSFLIFFIVFLNSLHRETPKHRFLFVLSFFFLKNLSTRFFRQTFVCSVFELQSLGISRKRDTTKKNRGKTDIEFFADFSGKVFVMCFYAKICL